ncbi:MAG: HDOD domain-containing protein [Clostridiaceae bacterium]|nr:HDOD domain-containing protein [Clostridiaceae bacterium]
MNIYVARQPIFRRNMSVYGYELFYRRSENNFYEGTSDSQATAELINNAFLSFGLKDLTGGSRAFINFSQEFLEKGIPFLLPKDQIVIEIVERVQVNETILKACNRLKENGYLLALDDFIFTESSIALLPYADIVKIEFSSLPYDLQIRMIKKFGKKTAFLAEKLETRDDFLLAAAMGYQLFQGYFFSKPMMSRGREVGALNINLIRILEELNHEVPEIDQISGIIEKDLGLSYKLVKASNSVYFGGRSKINSIQQAVVRLGLQEITKWIYLFMLKEVKNPDNAELIKTSLVRGKLMELYSSTLNMKRRSSEFFITGLFSAIDSILGRDMDDIVNELPLTSYIKEALLGQDNELRQMLNVIINYEKAQWTKNDTPEQELNEDWDQYMNLYLDALRWEREFG